VQKPPLPAPAGRSRGLVHILFGDLLSVCLTIATGALLLALLPRLFDWAVVSGVWSGDGTACKSGGACWAFLRDKYRQILFGVYPAGEQWRPAMATTMILAVALWSLPPRNWTRTTLLLWLVAMTAVLVLMAGGPFGLAPVPTTSWGGIVITLLLTVSAIGLGFPFAVVLALGRRSRMRVVSLICVAVVEIVRGLPLLSLLFIASILLPLMLPDGVSIDKLLRALVALTLFSAAYLAEVLRGGLQGVPGGQAEAAHALGLSWWHTTRLVVLPQAIRKVIPPLTNTVIVMVKNTSLVLVVGLFDLLSSGRAAATDPAWPAPYVESYLFVAAIYFAICFSISRYAWWLETRGADRAR
jgi:general L-amino acid transport system permease protein